MNDADETLNYKLKLKFNTTFAFDAYMQITFNKNILHLSTIERRDSILFRKAYMRVGTTLEKDNCKKNLAVYNAF